MKEVSEKHMKKIYLNILKAILVVIYFLTLNLVSEKISALYLERGIEICTMIFLFLAIFIFELAYKKDDDDLVVQGIEVLVLSAYTLTSQYITKRFNLNFKIYSLASSYIIAIYFVVKCIWYYTKGRKEIADDLSDIKEIVKEKEPVKKEATKRKKDKTEDEKLKDDVEIGTKKPNVKNSSVKSATGKKTSTGKKKTTGRKPSSKNDVTTTKKTDAKSKTTKTPATKKKTTTKVEKKVTENKEAKSKTTKTPVTKKKTTTKVEKDVTENKETKSKTTKTPATKKKATTKVEKQGIENKKKKTTKKKVDEEK